MKLTQMKKSLSIFVIISMAMIFFSSCTNHGEFITNVQPRYIGYDEILQQWEITKTHFTYDVYKNKNGVYIAVLKESDGKERDGKEFRVETNPYYRKNHSTQDYQYCVQQWYFNVFLPTTPPANNTPQPNGDSGEPPQTIKCVEMECPACKGKGQGWFLPPGEIDPMEVEFGLCEKCVGKGKICKSCKSSIFTTDQLCGGNDVSKLNDGSDSDPKRTGRALYQIDADIEKTERLLESNRSSLQHLMDNNTSVTLWPQYQRMIQQCEDRLEKLYKERASAN